MILDQYGKAIGHRNTFIMPDWLRREGVRLLYDRAADDRVRALRDSLVEIDLSLCRTGDTIQVKLPARFEART